VIAEPRWVRDNRALAVSRRTLDAKTPVGLTDHQRAVIFEEGKRAAIAKHGPFTCPYIKDISEERFSGLTETGPPEIDVWGAGLGNLFRLIKVIESSSRASAAFTSSRGASTAPLAAARDDVWLVGSKPLPSA